LPAVLPETQTAPSGGKCVLVVDSIVPERVRKYNGKRAVVDNSVNCWNTSLVLAELLPAFRNTTGEEMTFWMDSPLCRVIEPGQEPLPGDIITIRSPHSDGTGYNEVHGLIHVGGGLAFSKNGAAASQPFELQTLQGVLEMYGAAEEPAHCYQAAAVPNGGCRSYTSVYRCQTLDEYVQSVRRSPGVVSEEQLGAYAELDNCLREIENRWMADRLERDAYLDPAARALLRASLAAIEALANQELVKLQEVGGKDNPEAFLWISLLTRTSALQKQL